MVLLIPSHTLFLPNYFDLAFSLQFPTLYLIIFLVFLTTINPPSYHYSHSFCSCPSLFLPLAAILCLRFACIPPPICVFLRCLLSSCSLVGSPTTLWFAVTRSMHIHSFVPSFNRAPHSIVAYCSTTLLLPLTPSMGRLHTYT